MAWYDWRRYHKCSRFQGLEDGRCLFCRINENLIHSGYEAIPYDVPGPYKGVSLDAEDPKVILQPIRIEPGEGLPS